MRHRALSRHGAALARRLREGSRIHRRTNYGFTGRKSPGGGGGGLISGGVVCGGSCGTAPVGGAGGVETEPGLSAPTKPSQGTPSCVPKLSVPLPEEKLDANEVEGVDKRRISLGPIPTS